MKRAVLGVLVGCILLVPMGTEGQHAQKVIRSRGIEGYLEDSNGFAVQHAQVQVVRCPLDGDRVETDDQILRTGESDDAGRFKIDDVSGDQVRCVRVRKRGFSPLMVRVKLTMFASNMKLRLERIR